MSIRAIHSIEELLRSKNQFKKKIRVLTWQPQNSQYIEGFRLHISDGVYDNDPEKPITQVINAAGRWEELKKQYPDTIVVFQHCKDLLLMEIQTLAGYWSRY